MVQRIICSDVLYAVLHDVGHGVGNEAGLCLS